MRPEVRNPWSCEVAPAAPHSAPGWPVPLGFRAAVCRARRKRGDDQCSKRGQNQLAHDHSFCWERLKRRLPTSLEASAKD